MSSAGVSSGRKYEELEGASGREVFFRAPRYSSDAFATISVSATAWDNQGKPHALNLRDVSTSGLAVEAPSLAQLPVGTLLPRLRLAFERIEVYDGPVLVASAREVEGRRVLGMSLQEGPISLDDVLQLRDIKTWTGATPGQTLADRPWSVPGLAELKGLIADQRLLLDEAERHYAKMERELPWQVVHGETMTPARGLLIERVRAEFVMPWLESIYACDAALRAAGLLGDEASPDAANRIREFSRELLQRHYLVGPIIHRAATKPLGYPGDYGVMRYVYEQPFEGPTLFAKAMHLAGWSMACTTAVRNRKDVLRDAMALRLEQAVAEGRPLRIVSVAAGPAQEIFELLRDHTPPSAQVHVVLFEQDREALTFAQGRIQRTADPRTLPGVKVTFLHDSIRRLLKDPELFSRFGPFDMILCAGLNDYLPATTSVRLASQLYANLAEGGELYIGNLVPENPCRWILEHHLDWQMLHRDRATLLDMAMQAAPTCRARIVEEDERVNPFVVLERAAP
ncbi:MAG: class I SAM-dependent methyltransferase [Deltaproteobacteria bacterium]|nr:class I SAM-dependent methyltransferase [Deltaproteobacteria bacterium]